jgi:membrane dipeptidase
MNRRQVASVAGSLFLLGAARTPASASARQLTKGDAGTAGDLYRSAVVLDCNLGADIEKLPLSADQLRIYRDSGLTAIKSTIGGYADNFESTIADAALWMQVVETHPDVFMQIRRAADIATAKREGKLGVILSFEGVGMLDGKLERIDLFRQLGVRVMQLSYNTTSAFAAGVMADPASGLTELGRSAVARMNELGVAVDLSHANPRTTADAMTVSTRPVLITHGGCSAIHAHPRNKTDEQLRALAAKGGVIGIYDLPYLTASPRQPQVQDYMEHMAHALSVCGEDHVGIGSDQAVQPFDTSPESLKEFQKMEDERHAKGVAAPEEDRPTYVIGLNVPNRCEIIADALLQRHYPARVAEKVLGANFVRAFGDIWTV